MLQPSVLYLSRSWHHPDVHFNPLFVGLWLKLWLSPFDRLHVFLGYMFILAQDSNTSNLLRSRDLQAAVRSRLETSSMKQRKGGSYWLFRLLTSLQSRWPQMRSWRGWVTWRTPSLFPCIGTDRRLYSSAVCGKSSSLHNNSLRCSWPKLVHEFHDEFQGKAMGFNSQPSSNKHRSLSKHFSSGKLDLEIIVQEANQTEWPNPTETVQHWNHAWWACTG